MRQIDVNALSASLCQIAADAGAAVMSIYQEYSPTAAQLADKPDDSPLTMADLAAHNLIIDRLAGLTPEIPVVSEEDDRSLVHRTPKGYFWLIDPLDGTKEFLARNGEFTVNIALILDGEPIWGVVFAPALHQMFWGGRAYGSHRLIGESAEPIRVAPQVLSDRS